jgi:hypothetical protein
VVFPAYLPSEDICSPGTWENAAYYEALGENNATAINNKLAAITPDGNTPGGLTMLNANKKQMGLHDPTRLNYVVFISDGEPNCTGDSALTVNGAGALFSAGIKTFVVGFKDGVDANLLNNMAQAGGTARSGATKYYQANDLAELQAAFTEIVTRATTRPCFGCSVWGKESCIDGKWQNCDAPKNCCTSSHVICAVDGLYGQCAQGEMICKDNPKDPNDQYCKQINFSVPEECNGLDDDCDGIIDNPDKIPPRDCTNTCGNKGKEYCIVGEWAQCDAEPCCTNKGKPCITDKPGICAQGTVVCLDEKEFCQPNNTPMPEICNGLDDDCNSVIDNGVTNQCGGCGEIPETACPRDGADLCKGYDVCNPNQKCINGECSWRCQNNECPGNLECSINGYCVTSCNGVKCGQTDDCIQGRCVDLCSGITCEGGKTCFHGNCVPDNCYNIGCEIGEICKDSSCVHNPCDGVICDPVLDNKGQFCRDGICVFSCGRVTCEKGRKCVDGNCVGDPCYNVRCDEGMICSADADGGSLCVNDPCIGKDCGKGRVCVNGDCQDNPCNGVSCPRPVESCSMGQCAASDGGSSDAHPYPDSGPKTDAGDAGPDLPDAGPEDVSDAGHVSDGSNPSDAAHDPDASDSGYRPDGGTPVDNSGCSCSSVSL